MIIYIKLHLQEKQMKSYSLTIQIHRKKSKPQQLVLITRDNDTKVRKGQQWVEEKNHKCLLQKEVTKLSLSCCAYVPTPQSMCDQLVCMLDSFEGAIAKSARAAGISANLAEKYAAEMVQKLPGKKKKRTINHNFLIQIF